jgi:hypothetical protein
VTLLCRAFDRAALSCPGYPAVDDLVPEGLAQIGLQGFRRVCGFSHDVAKHLLNGTHLANTLDLVLFCGGRGTQSEIQAASLNRLEPASQHPQGKLAVALLDSGGLLAVIPLPPAGTAEVLLESAEHAGLQVQAFGNPGAAPA